MERRRGKHLEKEIGDGGRWRERENGGGWRGKGVEGKGEEREGRRSDRRKETGGRKHKGREKMHPDEVSAVLLSSVHTLVD